MPEPENQPAEKPQETVEEVKTRLAEAEAKLKNAQEENARKAQELQRHKEEADARTRPAEQQFNPQDLTTWKDHELKALQKDAQYASLHDQAAEILRDRWYGRKRASEQEDILRMDTEMERQRDYPETLDVTHPMHVKMNQMLNKYRLANTPSGRLVAARLASSDLEKEKTAKAKQDKQREEDIQNNFQGGPARPVPVKRDTQKLEEIKKRAQAGDKQAQAEWFRHKGII